jgi:hypothetical protein
MIWTEYECERVAAMIVGAVMTDHPSWRCCDDGARFRAVRVGSSAWVLTATPVALHHWNFLAVHAARTLGRLGSRAIFSRGYPLCLVG